MMCLINRHLRFFLYTDLATVCPPGTYRSESRMCLPCPPNTILRVDNATICPCLSGYFRSALDGPEDGCTRKSFITIHAQGPLMKHFILSSIGIHFVPEPPTACREIRATFIGDQNATISWERPEDVGRDDFYYVLSYSDGERADSFTVVSGDSVVEYTLRGLKPATDYTITVVVENGVSDQQPQSEPSRSCQVKLTTNEGSKTTTLLYYNLQNSIEVDDFHHMQGHRLPLISKHCVMSLCGQCQPVPMVKSLDTKHSFMFLVLNL